MFSYILSKIVPSVEKSFSTPTTDVVSPLYQHLDFRSCVVAGSYALHQLTGDTSWQPNDVDIVTTAPDLNNFTLMVKSFCAATGGRLVKLNDFSLGHPNPADAKRDEKFHEAIRASAKVEVQGVPLTIQFVYIAGLNSQAPAEMQLEEVSDLPSCVSYKVVHGKKMFYVPEKGREALFTRRVPKDDICPARMDKYAGRMYEFY